jgi:hypothetical protein
MTASAISARAGTILDLVARAWANGETPRFPVHPTVRIGRASLIPVAIDNGNDALKGAVLDAESRLHTIRIPTAFANAQEIQGVQEITYTSEGVAYWIGETALHHRGAALKIGPTRIRLGDDRQRFFIGAGIVELLRTAGYAPGSYQIALTIAVPNTEILIERGDGEGPEQLTVDSATREVIVQHLKGKVWTITREDDSRVPEQWSIRIVTALPQAQSVGTIVAASRSPMGKRLLDLDGVTVIDIGGGDLHVCQFEFEPTRMINRRPGDGTIRIAKLLRNDRAFAKLIKNDVEAQQALVTRKVRRSSQMEDIGAAVDRAIATEGQAMIADVTAELRDSGYFVVITGGGVLLLNGLLTDVLGHEDKVAGKDYLLVDGPLASRLNVIGILFRLISLAAGK